MYYTFSFFISMFFFSSFQLMSYERIYCFVNVNTVKQFLAMALSEKYQSLLSSFLFLFLLLTQFIYCGILYYISYCLPRPHNVRTWFWELIPIITITTTIITITITLHMIWHHIGIKWKFHTILIDNT